MMSDTEDPDAAAERLESALERIAQAALRAETRPSDQTSDQSWPAHSEEIAARLDDLIDRLRTALGRAD
jgi:hypothetical protein